MVINRIVHQLHEQGFAISHVDELFNERQRGLFDKVCKYYDEVLKTKRVQTYMKHVKTGNKAKLKTLTPRNKTYYLTQIEILGRSLGIEPEIPLVELYTEDVFLDVALKYLGSDCKIFNVISYIHPAHGMKAEASQNWHRDSEDAHQVKAFMYINDVGAEQGALEIVSGTSNPVNTPISPSAKFKNTTQLCGKAGAIVFFDGTNIHRGGLVRDGMRLMTQGLYLRPDAKMVVNGFYDSFQRNGKTNKINYKSQEYKTLSVRAQRCLTPTKN